LALGTFLAFGGYGLALAALALVLLALMTATLSDLNPAKPFPTSLNPIYPSLPNYKPKLIPEFIAFFIIMFR